MASAMILNGSVLCSHIHRERENEDKCGQMLITGELWESTQKFFEHFLQLFHKLETTSK